MRSLGRTLLALLTAVAFAGWGAPPRRLHAHAPDAGAVVRTYVAAWNAHDLDAVLAHFAPDAVVRERRGAVPPAVWDAHDPQVVRAYLADAHHGESYDPGGLVWALGQREIAAWAAAHFQEHHRVAVGPPRATGDTVGWRYRAFVDPYQLLPGVGPLDGDAEAVVRGGRITVLSLVQAPASVQRQRDELSAVVVARAGASGDGPSAPISGPSRDGEPPAAAWPVALGGLALLAAGTVALRRRRRPLP